MENESKLLDRCRKAIYTASSRVMYVGSVPLMPTSRLLKSNVIASLFPSNNSFKYIFVAIQRFVLAV